MRTGTERDSRSPSFAPLVIGLAFGGGLLATLAAFGLLLLLRFALIWIGVFLGLITPNAISELFGNPEAGGGSGIENNARLMAVVWPLLITAVFLPLTGLQ